MTVKRVTFNPRTLHIRLYFSHQFLFPSHPSFPSRRASVLTAKVARTDRPSLTDIANMRRHESTSYMASRRSNPSSRRCFAGYASYCTWPHFIPFRAFLLSYDTSRALYASFPSFTLAFYHRTSPHPLQHCAHRLAFGYNSLICSQFEH